jgi:murein DD-endopeptidase MepM/ murein hydrolase activator NlpD
MNTLQLWYPTDKFYVGQGFGKANTNPTVARRYDKYGLVGHNGLDLYAKTGDPIRASHEGVVTFAGLDGGAGKTIVLCTDRSYPYLEGQAYFKTIYGHLLEFKVKAGDTVKIGQVIALADNTGDSTGSHLHFGLKPQMKDEPDSVWYNLEPNNGYNGAIDPLPYFNHYYAKDIDYIHSNLTIQVTLLQRILQFLQLRKGR